MKYVVIGIVVLLSCGVLYFNFSEKRITPYENPIPAVLKSAVFAAQIQFQSAGYLDDDANGIGEYGFIEQLTGHKPTLSADGTINVKAGEIALLTGPIAQERADDVDVEFAGYYFAMYLPDGRGGMYDYAGYMRDLDKKHGAHLREQHYLVLAWPVQVDETKRHIWVMTEDGLLRSTTSVDVRDAFIKDPDWTHLFKGREGTFEEVLKQGPNDDWPYYSR